MKLKDFRETQVFKIAEIVQYYNAADDLKIPDIFLDFRNIKNKEVLRFEWVFTPGIKTLRIWLDY